MRPAATFLFDGPTEVLSHMFGRNDLRCLLAIVREGST
jgi:hypothetical protein